MSSQLLVKTRAVVWDVDGYVGDLGRAEACFPVGFSWLWSPFDVPLPTILSEFHGGLG